ncbi:MAG: septal ring lytic transglycosylase RlpA family protein [Rhodothermales bacterium]
MKYISSLSIFILMVGFALPTAHGQLLATADGSNGTASYYHEGYHGSTTASGEQYDHNALTAAHRTLPFNTLVRVTRVDNGRAVIVRVNDRMAMGPGKTIDLSGAAAKRLDMMTEGVVDVRIDVLDTGSVTASADVDSRPRVIGWSSRTRTTALDSKPAPVRTAVAAPDGPPAPVRTVADASEPDPTGMKKAPSRDLRPIVFTLQIGSFTTREGAREMAQAYDSAWVDEVVVNGAEIWRVYYSRYTVEQDARNAQKVLWQDGQDSFLRRVTS